MCIITARRVLASSTRTSSQQLSPARRRGLDRPPREPAHAVKDLREPRAAACMHAKARANLRPPLVTPRPFTSDPQMAGDGRPVNKPTSAYRLGTHRERRLSRPGSRPPNLLSSPFHGGHHATRSASRELRLEGGCFLSCRDRARAAMAVYACRYLCGWCGGEGNAAFLKCSTETLRTF